MGLIDNEKFERIRADQFGESIEDHYDDDGLYIGFDEESVECGLGNFQSMSERETQVLPEGKRERVTYRLYTDMDLRGASGFEDNPADKVRRQKTGKTYEVWKQTDHGSLIGDEEYILMRLEE